MCNFMTYDQVYNYVYEVLISTVDEFTNKLMQEDTVDVFLNLVIGFENYLNNGYQESITHRAVDNALLKICKERDCTGWWDLYSCNRTVA